MIPYDSEMRPVCNGTLGDHVAIGRSCVSCGRSALLMIGPVAEQADGSLTVRCDRCRAPLRMNPHGYVFFDPGAAK